MSQRRRASEEQRHAEHLREAQTNGQVVTEFRNHPGYAVMETLMVEYRSRSYRAFLDGEMAGEDFRCECRVLDFLKQAMDAVVTQGEEAGRELLKRGWK